jgi:5-methylcytosine-specific restriction enzyme subunit McrC
MASPSPKSLSELETYRDSAPIELTGEDMEFISTRLEGRMSLHRPAVRAGFILNPQQYAAVIPLPSGAVLRSRPRIPVRNLFLMLAVAYGLPPLTVEETVEFDRLDDVLELVVHYFCRLIEERLERGLYRAYVENEDNLSVVRGRIVFAEDLRRNAVLRHRTYCRYTELTWDIPENQVVRFVSHALTGWEFSAPTRARLDNIDRRMDEVARRRFESSQVARFQYHRLNADYEPIHDLCRLFLDEMSLSEEQGEYELNGFLLDMNDLFESFITEMLRRDLAFGWSVTPQDPHFLGVRQRSDGSARNAIKIVPDVVIRRGRAVRAVMDCKFKRTSAGSYQNHDFYQVISYCIALKTPRGALIYPKSELELEEIDETYIQSSPIVVRRFAVDLGVEPNRLPAELAQFTQDVHEWMDATGDRSEDNGITSGSA